MYLRRLGRDSQRASVGCDRVLQRALVSEDIAQVAMSLDQVRRELDGAAVAGRRLIHEALLLQG